MIISIRPGLSSVDADPYDSEHGIYKAPLDFVSPVPELDYTVVEFNTFTPTDLNSGTYLRRTSLELSDDCITVSGISTAGDAFHAGHEVNRIW